MINYPNGQKIAKNKTTDPIAKKISQANRGMRFEWCINQSNEYYLRENIAVIYKKPTPIKVLHILNTPNGSTKIDSAHFLTPSTTDYNGVYRGKYLDFEAKETRSKTLFSLAAIYPHQLKHLKQVAEHGGIAFVVICFTTHQQTYLIDQQYINEYASQGRSSISLIDIKRFGHLIEEEYAIPVNYLKIVDKVYF